MQSDRKDGLTDNVPAAGDVKPEDSYREQRAHHGRMHETLYRMPPQYAFVLGALWYFAGTQIDGHRLVAAAVFAFSALVAVFLVGSYHSFADMTERMRKHLERREGQYRANLGAPRLKTRSWFKILMAMAVVWSFAGAAYALAYGTDPKPAIEAAPASTAVIAAPTQSPH